MKLKERKIKYVEIKILHQTYIVEVYEEEDYTEFWLYNKAYGIKSQMFGIQQINLTEEEILEYIDSSLIEYIQIYKEEYEDV